LALVERAAADERVELGPVKSQLESGDLAPKKGQSRKTSIKVDRAVSWMQD
jgi:hypothetical protein